MHGHRQELSSGERRTSVDGQLNTRDATACTGVGDALHVDEVGRARQRGPVCRHADDALHRQRLDDGALVGAYTALALVGRRIDVLPVRAPKAGQVPPGLKSARIAAAAHLCSSNEMSGAKWRSSREPLSSSLASADTMI